MAKPEQDAFRVWADRIDWKRRVKAVCKPCWELKYCPYGPVVEEFPLEEPDERSCRIFGHHCPVFYVAEPLTETRELRNIGRNIPRPIQFRVLKRNNQICAMCCRPVLDAHIHFDHIIPWSKGGPTAEHNIRLLCDQCNQKRGASFEADYLVESVTEQTSKPIGLDFVDMILCLVADAQEWRRTHGRFPSAREIAKIVGVRKVSAFEEHMAQMLLDMQELFDGKPPAEITGQVFRALAIRLGFGADLTVHKIRTIARQTNTSTEDLVAAEMSMFRRLGWPVQASAEQQKRWAKL